MGVEGVVDYVIGDAFDLSGADVADYDHVAACDFDGDMGVSDALCVVAVLEAVYDVDISVNCGVWIFSISGGPVFDDCLKPEHGSDGKCSDMQRVIAAKNSLSSVLS